ncbi:hypothetical protein H8957_014737, partial [Semnopithecus entellus]
MPTLKIVFPRSTGWRPEIYISAGRQSWCGTHPIPTRKPFPSRFAALPRDWQTMTLQTVKRPSALPSPVPPRTATRSGASREFPLPDDSLSAPGQRKLSKGRRYHLSTSPNPPLPFRSRTSRQDPARGAKICVGDEPLRPRLVRPCRAPQMQPDLTFPCQDDP